MSSTRLALGDVRGPLDDLIGKLSGAEGKRWLSALKWFLRKENPWGKPFLHVNRDTPFDPVGFMGSGWTIWGGPPDGNGLEGEEQQDARSLALTDLDFTNASFETCLNVGEAAIAGEESLYRLRGKKNLIRADASIGVALFKEPGHKTLRWLCDTYRVFWFELPGTELRDPSGARYFLSLYCRNRSWDWICEVSFLGFKRDNRLSALVFPAS